GKGCRTSTALDETTQTETNGNKRIASVRGGGAVRVGNCYFFGWQLKSLQGLRTPRLSLPIKNQLPVVLRDDDGIGGVLPYPFNPFHPFVSFHPKQLTLHDSALTP